MEEGEPGNFENEPEVIHTPEEVQSVFEKILDGAEYETVRRLEDKQGLYLWDIKVFREDGYTDYSYMRKGKHPEGQAIRSAVHETHYDEEGFPGGGKSAAKWINGEWKMTS
ncbi:hypothetical protein ACFL2V_15175 [Pseudomonadota bacterium]